MTIPLNISVFFSGGDLIYSAEDLPAGLTVDGETGLITGIPTTAGVSSVSLTARNEAGDVTTTFTWTIEAAEAQTPPANASSPFIVGAAEVGSLLTADPGDWTGEPAPTFSYQWRRDDVDIPGAVEIDYRLAADDDLADISVTVTGENEVGAAEATTASRTVAHPAPAAAGALPDLTLTVGSGQRLVDASEDFSGATGGAWSVSGGGATIDQNGVVTISTDATAGQAEIVVRYQNSGGEAASAFSITLEEAADAGPVAITSGSVRFPATNIFASPAEMSFLRLPSPFGDGNEFGGSSAFFAHVEIPVESYATADVKTRMVILGNGNGGATNPGTMSLAAGPIYDSFATDGAEQATLEFHWNAGGVSVTADFFLGDHRRVLFVARSAGATTLAEIYANGVLIESQDIGLLAGGLRSDFAVGADADYNDPNLGGTFGGPSGGFDGAVGMIGYTTTAVSQAQCEAISAGSAPTIEIDEADWNMLRIFTDTGAASLASRASGDVLADAVVINGGFQVGSDIAPARNAAAWIAADYIPTGRVWGAAPGATEGKIKLSGLASGLTGDVEARYYDQDGTLKKDWTALTGADASGGSWVGTMTAPLGSGWGYIDVRPASDPSLVHRTRVNCGVGFIGAIVDQSNFEFPLDRRDLGTQPELGGAMSVVRRLYSGSSFQSGVGKVGLSAVEPGRRASDGIAAMADAIKRQTDVPVCLLDLAQSGTGMRQLIDDSIPERAWSDLVAIAEMGGATDDEGAGLASAYINWYASDAQLREDYVPEALQPMIEGTARPSGGPVDHYFQDGTFPATLTFTFGIGVRYQRSGGPFDSSADDARGPDQRATYLTMDYANANGWRLGAPVNDALFLDGGGHTAAGEPLGGQRVLERVVPSLLRDFGLDGGADPFVESVEIDPSDAGRLIATINLPNGGELETSWSRFPEDPPAGWPTVQGFEISIDGNITRSNGRDGAPVTFTAEIVDSANGIVHIERTDAPSWPTGTMWNYASPDALVYGMATEPLRLVHGMLSESGRNVSQGTGLLVFGPAQGVATGTGGGAATVAPEIVEADAVSAVAENASSVSQTFTAASGSDRIVIVGVAADDATADRDVSRDFTLTWGGVSGQRAISDDINSYEASALFIFREADFPPGETGAMIATCFDDAGVETSVRSAYVGAMTVTNAGPAALPISAYVSDQNYEITPTADDSLIIAMSVQGTRNYAAWVAPVTEYSTTAMPSGSAGTGASFGRTVQDAGAFTIQTDFDFGRTQIIAVAIEPA